MKVLKKLGRIISRIVLAVVVLLFIVFLIFTAPSWWRHWVVYPRLEQERAELLTKRKTPQKFIELADYKGIFHTHCYWSHDSRGVLKEIIPAAKKAKLQFIFFSDHPHARLDTFPRAYHGTYDGIVMVSGTETGSGLMVCPMDSVTINWSENEDRIIHRIVTNGGLVLYVHTEKPHRWANPDYQGMEIYNIHTDLLDEKSITPIIIDAAVNAKKYRPWVYRQFYDDQFTIWARWDSLNMKRRIVGMAGVDAHNNQNIRAHYLSDGRVEWVGPNAETLAIVKPGFKEKLLLGKPDAAGWAFKWEIDTYFASFHFVNTHVFSDTLSAGAIRNNLVKGHAYVSFEHLAEADGFQFFARDRKGRIAAIMGDSISVADVKSLHAVSPLPVQFQCLRNGRVINQTTEVYNWQFDPQSKAGVYRIVANVKLGDEWKTWVLSNPIYLY